MKLLHGKTLGKATFFVLLAMGIPTIAMALDSKDDRPVPGAKVEGPAAGGVGSQQTVWPVGNPFGMMPGGPGSANTTAQPSKNQGPAATLAVQEPNAAKMVPVSPVPSYGFARLAPDTESVERYLYDQKQRINISSAQEKAWNAFAQSVMNQISTRINVMNSMRKAMLDNPMDRTERHLTAMETAVKQQRVLFQDFRTLHDQLTAMQKPMVEFLYMSVSE
ncbi:MAG: hypothetical protein HQL79_09510 [Magnetococcales bacterium]|nr:hypothetical protein [Magnetococcales bacterium]